MKDLINRIKYTFLMWKHKGDTQKCIDIICKYDPYKILGDK